VRLRYTSVAIADLAEILDFVADRYPQQARTVQARIQAVIDLLLRYPFIRAATTNPEIRRMPTTPYPYVVFYEVANDEVIIHAVRHGARDPSANPGARR
jgi:toxin ParE1/3/4